MRLYYAFETNAQKMANTREHRTGGYPGMSLDELLAETDVCMEACETNNGGGLVVIAAGYTEFRYIESTLRKLRTECRRERGTWCIGWLNVTKKVAAHWASADGTGIQVAVTWTELLET